MAGHRNWRRIYAVQYLLFRRGHLGPPIPDAARMHPAVLVFVNAVLAMVSIAALIAICFG